MNTKISKHLKLTQAEVERELRWAQFNGLTRPANPKAKCVWLPDDEFGIRTYELVETVESKGALLGYKVRPRHVILGKLMVGRLSSVTPYRQAVSCRSRSTASLRGIQRSAARSRTASRLARQERQRQRRCDFGLRADARQHRGRLNRVASLGQSRRDDVMHKMQIAAKAGYRPGAVASTEDGHEVVVFSHPYTDGSEIFVLGLTKPGDPTSWKEVRIDELVLRDDHRTPAVPDE